MTGDNTRHDPAGLIELALLAMQIQQDDLVGTWPRVAAILARQALEMAIDQPWYVVEPGVQNATRRAQLICIREYVNLALAQRVTYAWHGLSSACHHHAYDLPPVASELKGWLDDVAALVDEVTRRHAT